MPGPTPVSRTSCFNLARNLLSLLFPPTSQDAQCPASCCSQTATTLPLLTTPLSPLHEPVRPPAPPLPVSVRKPAISDCYLYPRLVCWTPLNAKTAHGAELRYPFRKPRSSAAYPPSWCRSLGLSEAQAPSLLISVLGGSTPPLFSLALRSFGA